LACYQPRTLVGDDWTPERLRAELARNGLAYEGRQVPLSHPEPHQDGPDPGYFFRRPGDGRSREELSSIPRAPGLGKMRGFVVITRALSPTYATPAHLDPREGRMQLGPLVLHGDPAELRRILEALGYPVDPPRPDGADPRDFSRHR
jgi:hypothetical protein